MFAAIAAYGAIATMKSQRRQIDEQRQFIRTQTALLELDHRDRTWAQALGIRVTAKVRRYRRQLWWSVVVHNTSSAPVFDVDVTFGAELPAHRWDDKQSLATTAFRAYTLQSPISYYAPDFRVRLEHRGRLAVASEEWPRGQPGKERPTVEFTDATHVRWRLNGGELTKLGPVNGNGTD